MTLGYHLCLKLDDNRVIAPTPAERRVVASTILEHGERFDLLAFGLADTHPHLLAPRPREDAGELARRVEISLVKRLKLDVGFARPYFKPVVDGSHLNRAFIYILEQNAHHGLEWDPLHEASNLPDLLGLRDLGRYTAANVRRHLPRMTRSRLLDCLRLNELEPQSEPLEHLPLAAMAALGLPDLVGQRTRVVSARQAIIQLAGTRLKSRELAQWLDLSMREVQRLRTHLPNADLQQAIRLQLGLIGLRCEALRRHELPFLTHKAA